MNAEVPLLLELLKISREHISKQHKWYFSVHFTSLYMTEHIKHIELTVFYSFLVYLIAFFKIPKRVAQLTLSFVSVFN
jgi:hypothetical protein